MKRMKPDHLYTPRIVSKRNRLVEFLKNVWVTIVGKLKSIQPCIVRKPTISVKIILKEASAIVKQNARSFTQMQFTICLIALGLTAFGYIFGKLFPNTVIDLTLIALMAIAGSKVAVGVVRILIDGEASGQVRNDSLLRQKGWIRLIFANLLLMTIFALISWLAFAVILPVTQVQTADDGKLYGFIALAVVVSATYIGLHSRLMFYPFLIVDGEKMTESFRRSFEMTKRHWGTTLVWSTMNSLYNLVIGAAIILIGMLVFGKNGNALQTEMVVYGLLWAGIAMYIGMGSFVNPLFNCGYARLYRQMKDEAANVSDRKK